MTRLLHSLLLLFSLAPSVLSFDKIVDWSSVTVQPDQKWYGIDGVERPLEYIFKENSINVMRSRLWAGNNNPNTIENNIKLAKRAQAAGLDVYINVFFRDWWTDPGQIHCYSGWGNTVESISKGIYSFGKAIGDAFADAGVYPKYIQLGNEITFGVCDLGRIESPGGAKNTATFLTKAIQGVRDSRLGQRGHIMLHVQNSWWLDQDEYFFDSIYKAGLDSSLFDTIAVTAYPFYGSENATQTNFHKCMSTLRTKYNKNVVIAETSWPRIRGKTQATLPPDTVNHLDISVQGQAKWIEWLGNTCKNAGCTGMTWWEPAWLNFTSTGSPYDNTLLFEWWGKALPSLAAFKLL